MPLLEGFWIKNYRSLRQVAVGSCFPQFVYISEEEQLDPYELSPITLFVGNNGTGKSTLLDAFSFIADCLDTDVIAACAKRGGFSAIHSYQSSDPMSFGFNFRLTPNARVLTYVVNIDCKTADDPYLDTELLAYRESTINTAPLPILFLQNGAKIVRHFMTSGHINDDVLHVERLDKRHLATPILAKPQKYPVIAKIREFFQSNSIWPPPLVNQIALGNKFLEKQIPGLRGNNIRSLIQYFQKHYPEQLNKIFSQISSKLPQLETLKLELGGKLTFQSKWNPLAVSAAEMPEGLLKLVMYLLLLAEPAPSFWTVIEEPEINMDQEQIWVLARELAESAKLLGEQQFFISTQSSKLADWSSPRDVWILEKGSDGFSQVQRGCDSLVFADSNTPSDLWYSEYIAPIWQRSM